MSRASKNLGAAGEKIAEQALRRQRRQIIDRNFRTRFGELDIVFSDRGTLVFCEVKTRRSNGSLAVEPLESITPVKQAKIKRMAAIWLSSQARKKLNRHYPQIRFDVIGLVLDRRNRIVQSQHVKDAF